MYIVTFYSFKGGVGRSMALANVASELARQGKRVLVVDFDLEAPGLNTFDLGHCHPPSGGIINYVSEYIETSRAPNIHSHVSKCQQQASSHGEIWIMPAGNPNNNYSNTLSRINWQDLYERKQGFLFFEDLKAQWEGEINPDYVLIDSRTGHTDVGGICTRQLPNAVVFLFFPNEQNLHGLKKVVEAVNLENKSRDQGQEITKHFVNSNVPDLDDENKILSGRLQSFLRELNYKELTATIHRYNSLSLLNQEIFTQHRPNTRLAEEYRDLTRKIVSENLEDTQGAEAFLKKITSAYPYDTNLKTENVLVSIEKIQILHSKNILVLGELSRVKEVMGDLEESLSLLIKKLNLTPTEAILTEDLLRKARLELSTNNPKSALEELRKVLTHSDIGYREVSQAINLLHRASPENIGIISDSNALLSLDCFSFIHIACSHLQNSSETLSEAAVAIENYQTKHKELTADELDHLNDRKALIYIGLGKFKEARKLLSENRPTEESTVGTIFNYAIAEWAETQEPPIDLFTYSMKKLENEDFSGYNPNLKQCSSLCFWATGYTEKAISTAQTAIEDIQELGAPAFSCWSYLELTEDLFIRDTKEMIEMYQKNDCHPHPRLHNFKTMKT